MALEGNLNDFGLSEILQLIAVQQKSGMLSVTSKGESMVLFFRNGRIISTRDRRRKDHDPLKEYLLRYGVLSREQFMRIVQLSTQSNLDITDIIVSEGYLSEEEMKRHYRNHIQESLHEVLTWEQCSYKFIPNPGIVSGMKTWGEYGIEGLLMESMRRIDEFPQMLAEFPDPEATIKKSGQSGKELSRNEKAVLDLIGEGATLSHLVSHAKMPAFDTYEALKHLKEKRVIETGETRSPRPSKQDAPLEGSPAPGRGSLLPTLVSLLIFAAAAWLGAEGIAGHLRPQAEQVGRSIYTGSIARRQTEEKLRHHLEAYRALYGTYPPSLEKVEEAGLLDKRLLERAKALSFRYRLTANRRGYTLF